MRSIVAGLAGGFCLFVAVCAAETPADVMSLIERFHAHQRVAAGYLRTQNADLAAVELERLRDRWSADRRAIEAIAPAGGALGAALRRTEAAVEESLKAADRGDLERAAAELREARASLDRWRQVSGIRLFSDCIGEIGTAFRILDPPRREGAARTGTAAGALAAAADGVLAALDRCQREAPAPIASQPEFARLMDGMHASLRQLPGALAAGDDELVHRLLIEQRSFEQLLAFRFG